MESKQMTLTAQAYVISESHVITRREKILNGMLNNGLSAVIWHEQFTLKKGHENSLGLKGYFK